MQTQRFYDELPNMEFIAGDTLPVFNIRVIVEDGTSTEGSSMQLMVARANNPTEAIISKECTAKDDLFTVRLTGDDTIKLTEGAYNIYLVFKDTEDLEYKKIFCRLYVKSAPRG